MQQGNSETNTNLTLFYTILEQRLSCCEFDQALRVQKNTRQNGTKKGFILYSSAGTVCKFIKMQILFYVRLNASIITTECSQFSLSTELRFLKNHGYRTIDPIELMSSGCASRRAASNLPASGRGLQGCSICSLQNYVCDQLKAFEPQNGKPQNASRQLPISTCSRRPIVEWEAQMGVRGLKFPFPSEAPSCFSIQYAQFRHNCTRRRWGKIGLGCKLGCECSVMSLDANDIRNGVSSDF